MVPSPIGKVCAVRLVAATVLNACPVLVATIIEPVLPAPKLAVEAVDVDVRLKAPNEMLPAVSVRPVVFETVTLLPKVKVVLALFIVIPVNANGLLVPNKLPVIAPLPPIANGPVAVNVAAPNAIAPFNVNVFAPIAITPAVAL